MKPTFTQNKPTRLKLSQPSCWFKRIRAYLAIILFLNICVIAQAQTREISGQVVDETGIGLPGASILVKGTSQGTVTDIDGNFTISVEGNSTLVFSYTGFAVQEIEVGDQTVINVTMNPDAALLGEVVVIGYGTQKRSDVTGAVSSVNSEAIAEVPATDVAQALQGRIAGVDLQRTSSKPGADMQIRIRGNRSLGAPDGESNNPLIVVDGIPYLGSLTSINQGDIESVDILKDASATAIYGSRGSNGVIIITTKRGKAGQSKVSYNGYVGLSKPLAQYEVFNGEEYASLVLESNFGPLTPDETESVLLNREVNWQDLMYKDGYITNHELSFTGGTEKTQYLASGSFFEETNAMPGQAFTRYSLRLNLDHRVSERIKVGINTFTTYALRDGEGVNPFFGIVTYSPLLKPYTDEGEINRNFYQGHIDEPFAINPLLYYNEDLWEQQRKRLQSFSSLYGEVEFFDGLRYRLNVGLDVSYDKRGTFYSGQLRSAGTNEALVLNAAGANYTVENLLLFDKTIANNHKINFTGLFSVQENEWSQQEFSTTGVTSDLIQYYHLGLGSSVLPEDQFYSQWGLLSYMARINYNFADRYLLTLTGRADGSSRLAKGNKWFVYPAAAVAWNISNESFMANSQGLSTLKLRLGWGRTSNQAISPFQSLGRLSDIPYSYGPDGGELGYYVTNLPNQDLTWEFTSAYNLGLDFGLVNDRINGSIEVYQQNTEDILQSRTLPIMSGVSGSFQQNIGSTVNKGLELTLNARILDPVDRDAFKWEVNLNFTTWKEEITQLFDTLQSDITNGWFVGHPIDVVYDYQKIGIWQLGEEDAATSFDGGLEPGDIKVADLNGNGVRDEDDRSVLGHLNPDWIGGLTSRFSFKGVDLSVVMFARVGGLIVSRLHQANPSFQIATLEGRRNGIRVDYWRPDNPTNSYPKSGDQFPQFGSTLGYFDGTFMKIRSINLGYSLPTSVLESLGINSARFYLTANNPFKAFFSDLVDAGAIDPEPNNRGDTNTPGFGERLNMSPDTPIMKSFIFGLNLEF